MEISSWPIEQHLGLDKGERDHFELWLGPCLLDGSLRGEINFSGWLTEKLTVLDGILHGSIRISNMQDTIAVDR
jgi:hypothetical protein